MLLAQLMPVGYSDAVGEGIGGIEVFHTDELAPLIRWHANVFPFVFAPVLYKDRRIAAALEGGPALFNVIRSMEPEAAAEFLNEYLRYQDRHMISVSINFVDPPFLWGDDDLMQLLILPAAEGKIMGAELMGFLRKDDGKHLLPELRRLFTDDHFGATRVRAEQIRDLEFDEVSGVPTPASLASLLSNRDVPLDLEIRAAAAWAMEQIAPGDPATAVAVVHRLLHDTDVDQRLDAARMLARFGEGAADQVDQLVQALGDKDNRVVAEVITALGNIGPAARVAIPTLGKLAEDEDKQVAERAKAALRQIREDGG